MDFTVFVAVTQQYDRMIDHFLNKITDAILQ